MFWYTECCHGGQVAPPAHLWICHCSKVSPVKPKSVFFSFILPMEIVQMTGNATSIGGATITPYLYLLKRLTYHDRWTVVKIGIELQ